MQNDNSDKAPPQTQVVVMLEPVSVPIEKIPEVTGLARTQIYEAVADGELTARKAGKATIIELPEIRRFIRSLPTKGRKPAAA